MFKVFVHRSPRFRLFCWLSPVKNRKTSFMLPVPTRWILPAGRVRSQMLQSKASHVCPTRCLAALWFVSRALLPDQTVAHFQLGKPSFPRPNLSGDLG